MSIQKAISRAYNVAMERDHEMIFWCIDLHGTVLESNYSSDSFNFINEAVTVPALQAISALPESRIILWSGISDADRDKVIELFTTFGIRVDWVNENPAVPSSGTGHFDKKFYFSILVDDKAGFCPSDWSRAAEHAVMMSQELKIFREEFAK
ncbi:hypothetical protein D3C75_494380 [compost metagenome]